MIFSGQHGVAAVRNSRPASHLEVLSLSSRADDLVVSHQGAVDGAARIADGSMAGSVNVCRLTLSRISCTVERAQVERRIAVQVVSPSFSVGAAWAPLTSRAPAVVTSNLFDCVFRCDGGLLGEI